MSEKVEEAKNNEEQNNQDQNQPQQNQENQQEVPQNNPENNTPTPNDQQQQNENVENNQNQNVNEQNNQNQTPNENEQNNQNQNEPNNQNQNEGEENKNEPTPNNEEGVNNQGEEHEGEGEGEGEEGQPKPEEKKEEENNKIDKEEEEKLYKKMKKSEDKDIQSQIQKETIQIEQKKIDLRIMKERLAQKEKMYNELQGKPVNKTSEEKEKERRDHRKAVKSHKFTDPIVRKKGREKQIADDREKLAKEEARKKSEFQKLTTDINELIISNRELKAQILDLRKRKVEALKKREEIIKENEERKQVFEDLQKQNEVEKSKIMHKELRKAQTDGVTQQKEYEAERDDLEEEYHKLREEYIKRERENKKENAKKRNMAALALSNKGMSTSSRDKDMEAELKKLADEEIMDRTPMLDVCIEKWRAINNIKKTSIQIFQQNSSKIREAFEKLTAYIGLDSFEELPIVYKKTEQQMSNINMYKEKLELQNDQLEYERDLIIKQIELLSGKKRDINKEKSDIKKKKLKNIEIIEDCHVNFEKENEIRMKFIEKIQPPTNEFLAKLGDTFLADFICRKINIDDTNEYNEKTVEKYLSNVQDYFKLVQEWDKSTRGKKDSEVEIDKLREDMKQKLGRFEQKRLLSEDVYNSMQLDYKKGIKLEDIIRKSSQKIALDIQNPYTTKSTVATKGVKGKNKKVNISVASTEPGNYRYGNDSNVTNNRQSSIVYPSKTKKSQKVPVAA